MANRGKEADSRPQLTVVIGTLNRPHVVLKLIDQLKDSIKNFVEVLVFDQSSSENYSILKDHFPKIDSFKLIHFDEPNTVLYLNSGWETARSPVVLYLDDDVAITDKTIKSHMQAYIDPSIKAVAGRVINDGEKITGDPNVGKVLWYGAVFKKNFTYKYENYVDFPYGCNMSYRKEILESIGGFDEKLAPPIYSFNEVDLGYRISRIWKNSIKFLPDALVYHHRSKSGGTRNDFDTIKVSKSNNFNYGYFLGKNFSYWENFLCFVRRLPYQVFKEPSAIGDIYNGYIYAKKNKE